jgi:hypothetical protein
MKMSDTKQDLYSQIIVHKDHVKELKARIATLEAEVKELEEIETDLNGTVSYAEMGVATWKARAEELEAELDKHRWIPVAEGLPEARGHLNLSDSVEVTQLHEDGEREIKQMFYAYGIEDRWMPGIIGIVTHWRELDFPSPLTEAKTEHTGTCEYTFNKHNPCTCGAIDEDNQHPVKPE